MIAKLQAAASSIQSGQVNTAINQLQALINEVNAYISGGMLTSQQGGDLIADAEVIILLLESSQQLVKQSGAGVSAIPESFALNQNHPNPFNPATVIRYDLPTEANVRLEVFNLFGQVVAQLLNERKPAGYHEVVFDASRVASGTYFYRLTTSDAAGKPLVMMKKMLLMK
jgi:hypothetical protein